VATSLWRSHATIVASAAPRRCTARARRTGGSYDEVATEVDDQLYPIPEILAGETVREAADLQHTTWPWCRSSSGRSRAASRCRRTCSAATPAGRGSGSVAARDQRARPHLDEWPGDPYLDQHSCITGSRRHGVASAGMARIVILSEPK
jgi:hypothetical protein